MSLHRREVDILRRRAASFLRQAELALEQGSYDVSCFLSEQALQLYLKSILLELVGDYPRTHSIRMLLGEINRIIGSKELSEFIRRNRARIIVVEDAYLMSRYFDREYSREEAEEAVRLVKEILGLLENILRERGLRYDGVY